MAIHIGTSGWSYAHWQGVLYPVGLPVRERLACYVQHFQTVEVNSTFYRWPRKVTFAHWYRRLPPGFCLSVKAPRGLTHGARLHAPEAWLSRIQRGLQPLGEKCGVLLVQLPPDLPCDLSRLDYFLQRLPAGRRVAIEFRHPSWHQEAVFLRLERYQVAYSVMSGANLPCLLRATAPFVYLRLHGPDPHWLYAGSYSEADLGWWAERIHEWARQGHDVFVYFNNDGNGNAVRNAWRLQQRVNDSPGFALA